MSDSFAEVLYVLNHWLRRGQNNKAVTLTIECENDEVFYNTYSNFRAEISVLQYVTHDPREGLFSIKKEKGQLQFKFEMMGHKITIKSKDIRIDPPRSYFWGIDLGRDS